MSKFVDGSGSRSRSNNSKSGSQPKHLNKKETICLTSSKVSLALMKLQALS